MLATLVFNPSILVLFVDTSFSILVHLVFKPLMSDLFVAIPFLLVAILPLAVSNPLCSVDILSALLSAFVFTDETWEVISASISLFVFVIVSFSIFT
nr:MAG TPA: hypothetical protein [Bacteriophage sp.]